MFKRLRYYIYLMFECKKSCYISRCLAETSRMNLVVFRFMLYCVVEPKYRNCLSVAILFIGLLLCFIFCDSVLIFVSVFHVSVLG